MYDSVDRQSVSEPSKREYSLTIDVDYDMFPCDCAIEISCVCIRSMRNLRGAVKYCWLKEKKEW